MRQYANQAVHLTVGRGWQTHKRVAMPIIVIGAGMQGTLYGVRLARAGHGVALIAHGQRATELHDHGAIIEHALTGNRRIMLVPLAEELTAARHTDLCLVTVGREQLDSVLPALIVRLKLLNSPRRSRHQTSSSKYGGLRLSLVEDMGPGFVATRYS
jgi:hypothetical protein